jgi:uncharacterized protein YvpB
MNQKSGRSCLRLASWLLLAGLLVVALGAVAVGAVVMRRQAAEVTSLRAQVDELAARARLVEADATTTALDDRLAALERAASLAAQATAEPAAAPATVVPEACADPARQAALAGRIEELERQVAALATANVVPGPSTGDGGVPETGPDEAPGGPAPQALPGTVRLAVEPQKQRHNLSCESCAAAMAARYHGVDVSEEDVLAALPRHDNPHLGFRGNVDGPTGGTVDYGVYAAPVAAVLSDLGLNARIVEGGLAGIRAALARGNPVVAWVTYDCLLSTPVTVTVTGEPVVLVPYQHAVVVTGYEAGGVWANDPWDGGEEYYQEANFERAMSYFSDMAIEVAAPGD